MKNHPPLLLLRMSKVTTILVLNNNQINIPGFGDT
jgi:hypothetical protein